MLKVDKRAFIIARAKECLTTDELAEKAGIGRNTIARIENSKTNATPAIIGKLARALNVPVESLLIED